MIYMWLLLYQMGYFVFEYTETWEVQDKAQAVVI